ncbi:transposase [bacterium]|nr:transposase [bacterium]
MESLPPEVRNRRNNVEATIFQLSYHSRNNKTRYRGQIKNKVWATCRSVWINLIRIRNHVKKTVGEAIPATA